MIKIAIFALIAAGLVTGTPALANCGGHCQQMKVCASQVAGKRLAAVAVTLTGAGAPMGHWEPHQHQPRCIVAPTGPPLARAWGAAGLDD